MPLASQRNKFSLIKPSEIPLNIYSILREVNSLDKLDLNLSKILGYKKGDLNLVHSKSVRCSLKDYPESPRLILTQLDCLDQTVYNMKVHELETMIRYSHHPNIINVYSYWNESSENPFTFKILYILSEEGTIGDVETCIIKNPLKPSKKIIMKYICDMAKGKNLFFFL